MGTVTDANKAKITRRRKRSKRTIARLKKAQAAKRLEREQKRATARAEAELRRQEADQQRYDAQTAKALRDAYEREKSEKLVRWWMWSETGDPQYYDAETQWYEDQYRKAKADVLEAKRRAKIAGDPQNLTGHTKRLTGRQAKKLAEEERLAEGKRKHTVVDPEQPRYNVLVDSAAHAFHNLPEKGDEPEKKGDPSKTARHVAALRFKRDYDLTHFSGLRSSQFDERVDSSGLGSGHSHTLALEASGRLKAVREGIGLRFFEILEARIGLESSSEDMHRHGGTDHRSNNNDLVVALNALVNYYDGPTLIDKNWEAARKIKAEANSKIRAWRAS